MERTGLLELHTPPLRTVRPTPGNVRRLPALPRGRRPRLSRRGRQLRAIGL